MVANIENKLRKNDHHVYCEKTRNFTETNLKNINTSAIIEYLLKLQMRLRNDLTEIEWPLLDNNNYCYMKRHHAD